MLENDERPMPETSAGTAEMAGAEQRSKVSVAAGDYAFDEEIDPADLELQPFRAPDRKHVVRALIIVLLLLMLALLPPLINVSRYQRQIASSISASLGRPVRIDSVKLNLLPMPSFILENFVLGEDPAFGSEPVIRAGTVRAVLRVSSLWERRVEFSTISLTEPSVNLVHLPDGRWNVESILLQAARVPAAPTDQKVSTVAPRFPYIEATGARVNLKMGLEKMPLALTEAKFALWLPEPNQWRLRLEGHPNRTDTAATDTGAFQLEGSLGHAASLAAVPVDLTASWTAAPLGAVSWMMLGRDVGLRGQITVHATMQGSIGRNRVQSRLELRDVRRADFVPRQTLNADIACSALAADLFHQLQDVRCRWPADAPARPEDASLTVTGTVPELLRPGSARLAAQANRLPLGMLLDGLRIASPRVGSNLSASGELSGSAVCCGSPEDNTLSFSIARAKLADGDQPPFLDDDVHGQAAAGAVLAGPVELDLGAPAPALLEWRADWHGYTLRLTGAALPSRVWALAGALPQFGDGLEQILTAPADPAVAPSPAEQPVRIDATATRSWFGGQSWTAIAAPAAKPKTRHRR
jgi:AsmA protein